jgi:hypothetical protein
VAEDEGVRPVSGLVQEVHLREPADFSPPDIAFRWPRSIRGGRFITKHNDRDWRTNMKQNLAKR